MGIIGVLFLIVFILWGIYTVDQRYCDEGICTGFKSLMAMFFCFIGLILMFTGYGSLLGFPIVYICVKYFLTKI